ncbi:MAG TPA: helix-turn-helix domain-containing GNAT family N-acetyltransferase [Terriglobales bacterium]
MQTSHKIEQQIAAQIAAIREFNRFYTARLGILRKRHLDGEFALTEARILYEIGAHPGTTASVLRATLELDAGYISRLLSSLTKRKFVRQASSKQDGRERLLTLTAAGERAVARLNEQSTMQIHSLLANVNATGRDALVDSVTKIRTILGGQHKPDVHIVRLSEASDDLHAIVQEYYAAVQVVVRDKPGSLQKIIDTPASGIWLAYMGDEMVGCVVLRKMATIPRAGECKRLYVKPSARGHRIGDQLLDAMEAFARDQKLKWIYLDSHDGLKTAIALYERRGYERCERYNDNPQATVFMRKHLA